ncbi:S-layer homology domain-containing protein [Anoxybacterium hadale]|uniref:S-layer homology domain-containing protein n=1 Tax=Anoxybacterium hadale TaxID=3408580 RepID=UPI003B00EFDE
MTKTIRKKLLASILSIAMLISFMPAMTLTVNAAEPEPYTATATVNDSLPLPVSELYGLGDFSDIFIYCVQGYTQPSSGSNIAMLYFADPDLSAGAGEVDYLDKIDDDPDDTVGSKDEKIYFKANTAGEYTFYIRIYDYVEIDVTRKITVTVTDGDTTKPTLTAGTVNRTSNTTATVNFTSDTEGSYYYKVVEDGAPEPTIDTDGAGTTCTTSETTITNPTGLTAGARDIYIIVKDGAGNKSTSLRIDIDAYISSSDATLKTSSTVKGDAVTSLGTPSATLGSEAAGAVTITAAKAADTSNAESFITLFDRNESHATVKVVKYASGASTTNFETDTAYDNGAITDGDFFIIKVTAEDATTINYYKINVSVTPAPSTAKAITAFSFNGLTPNVTGTVNEGAKTIALTVPYGTDVTALVPAITHTGASVSPNTGVAQNFTNPVTYTVTAADSSTQQYTVTVSIAANPAKAITAFNFNGLTPNVTGTVNEGAKTIALTVPYGTDVTALVPAITHTGASVSPNTGVAQNFTNPVTYTVTAADSSTQQYTVTVSVAANPAKAITAFNFNGLTPNVTGTVNEGAKTIALTVPYGTDVTALVPAITHTGASVSPNTGVAQNFTNPVTYTVTAADSSSQAYTVTVSVAANPAKAITAFNFNGLTPNVTGTVNEGAKTIALTVPYGTDVTALVPAITHTGASVSPNTGVAQNFTNPVTYTVTAADSSSQAYTVTVSVAANPAKAITAFNFNGLTPNVTGTVNEGAKTIALTVPYGTDVTALVPAITHTGASVSPNTGVAQNFTNPVTYTVTAADSSTQQYTVTVSVAANPAKAITAFNFNGLTPNVTGTVNEGAKTIVLTVPYGTDVTALVPAITHTGVSVSPNTGVAQNFTNPVTYTVTAADSSTQQYTVTVSVAANPAKAITAFNFNGLTPNVTGTVNEGAKTIVLTVPYGTDVTALVPAITHTGASVSPNTGVAQNFTNPVTYTVTAADSSSQQYTVTVSVATSSSSGGGSGSSTTATSGTGTVIVVVNGKIENAGTETKSTEDGKSTVTVAINSKTVETKIAEAVKSNTTGQQNVMQVPVADTKSDVVKVELTGDIVKQLETNTFDVSVKRDAVEYVIPAKELAISNAAKELGVAETSLKVIKVEVQITKLEDSVVAKYNEVAKENGATIVFPPTAFEVVAKTTNAAGKTEDVKINKFSNYVERIMEIPAGVDPSKITTGVVFNSDGSYSHIPTDVYQKDGKWYAKLNSLTNSNYSVVWNPVAVKSVENHWAKDAVSDMASRLVIFNAETFEPNKAITRADFAEYIVRALGLYRQGEHQNKFIDINAKGDRTLAILIANEYGIVTGYSDGTFRGDNQITREEAMTMYQRAMKITKLTGSDTNRINTYVDSMQVSKWAVSYVTDVLSAHVFNGTTATTIAPKANLTYAEAAQAIRNLLVESKLINK